MSRSIEKSNLALEIINRAERLSCLSFIVNVRMEEARKGRFGNLTNVSIKSKDKEFQIDIDHQYCVNDRFDGTKNLQFVIDQ